MIKGPRKDPVNYSDLADRLGGELVTLQKARAKTPNDPSPGKFMVIEIEGVEHRLEPDMLKAIDTAIKEAKEGNGAS